MTKHEYALSSAIVRQGRFSLLRYSSFTCSYARFLFAISCMRWFGLLLLVALQSSCTTLVNRRDLYSPEPGPESLEAARQWYGVTTMSTTTTIRTPSATGEIAPPEFRY